MPLGTLDRSAPTLFKQGPSPLSRLTLSDKDRKHPRLAEMLCYFD